MTRESEKPEMIVSQTQSTQRPADSPHYRTPGYGEQILPTLANRELAEELAPQRDRGLEPELSVPELTRGTLFKRNLGALVQRIWTAVLCGSLDA